MKGERLGHLIRFYSIIEMLESNIGGAKKLTDCSGRMSWPKRGVYFFREPGKGPRIVRVGTHALKFGSGTKLWTRLSQHKGQQASGSGNHRGSIFRFIVGESLISRDESNLSTWGNGIPRHVTLEAASKLLNAKLAWSSELCRSSGSRSEMWPVRRAGADTSKEIR